MASQQIVTFTNQLNIILKMKHVYILLFVLFLAFNASAQDNKIVIQKANLYATARVNADFKTIIAYTYPGLLQNIGGKDEVLNHLISKSRDLFALPVTKFVIGHPGRFYKAGQQIHCLIPATIYWPLSSNQIIKFPDQQTEVELLAISDDGGQNWTFINIDQFTIALIPYLFPDFNPSLKIRTVPPVTLISLPAIDYSKTMTKQGASVAISADGNTIAFCSGAGNGKTWIYKRVNDSWLQSAELIDTLSRTSDLTINEQYNDNAMLMSSDGNTIIVAKKKQRVAWAYTCNNGVWSEGSMLAIARNYDPINKEYIQIANNIALSGDGNTAILGGWVFTKKNGGWSEGKTFFQGSCPVALNNEGNKAIIGLPELNNNKGTALAFVKKGNYWEQAGGNLTVANITANGGNIQQGTYVAISSNGNVAVQAGQRAGAFVFRQNNNGTDWNGFALPDFTEVLVKSVVVSGDGNTVTVAGDIGNSGRILIYGSDQDKWVQQGPKLVGSGMITSFNVSSSNFGSSIGLSFDGNTAVVGFSDDNSFIGAVWVFTRNNGVWKQMGNKIVAKW